MEMINRDELGNRSSKKAGERIKTADDFVRAEFVPSPNQARKKISENPAPGNKARMVLFRDGAGQRSCPPLSRGSEGHSGRSEVAAAGKSGRSDLGREQETAGRPTAADPRWECQGCCLTSSQRWRFL